MLICPVCGKSLEFDLHAAHCENGHAFDIAKDGYINLLRSTKSGDLIGDDKVSARCRRDFLNKGYYASLKNGLCDIFKDRQGSVLDICCGEGYYTSALSQNNNLTVYGFDISREMVRLAAKRGGCRFFVANMASIPVAQESWTMRYICLHPFRSRRFPVC